MSKSTFEQNPAAGPLVSMKAHHIAVRVPDYESATRWYVEKLGFRVIQEWPFGDLQLAYVAPPHDDAFLIEIIGNGEMAEGSVYDDVNGSLRAGGHHHLCLTVDNVDEAVAHLHRNGVTVIGEPFNVDAINRRLAFFTDPWGNFFELAEAI